jgi:hypothetical protein
MFGRKGKIDIAIQKTDYAPGDVISGNVALILKKPVNAREVSISLVGTAWVTTYSGTTTSSGVGIAPGAGITLGGGKSSSSWKERKRIYDFKQQLDSEKEYSEAREYRFEIKIPADIPQMPKPEGGVRRGSKVAQAIAAVTSLTRSSPIKWYLSAKLDIPGGLDISKKVNITIG